MITLQSHNGNIAVLYDDTVIGIFQDDIEQLEALNQSELKDYLNKKNRSLAGF